MALLGFRTMDEMIGRTRPAARASVFDHAKANRSISPHSCIWRRLRCALAPTALCAGTVRLR